MSTRIRKVIPLFFSLMLCIACIIPVHAKSKEWTNQETGYTAYIQDNAELLTEEEYQSLIEEMKPITKNGNVVFYTTNTDTSMDTRQIVVDIWEEEYRFNDNTSGSIFFIGMGTRQLYLYNTGLMKKCINSSYSTSIVDNTYRYATNGDYEKCAAKTFQQIYAMSEGGTIIQPMRYINSILTAVLLAIFVSYLAVKINRDRHKAEVIPESLIQTKLGKQMIEDAVLLNTAAVINQRISKPGINSSISQLKTRTYHVSNSSSSSSGGHSGGGSSGGFSGGGGSGGGHGF